MDQRKVSEIMKSPVVTVHEDDTFASVYEKLMTYHIRHVVVVDDAGVIAGILSQRDIYRNISPRITESGPHYEADSLNQFILKEVMTKKVSVVTPDDPIVRAAEIVSNLGVGCVPVVDHNQKPIGMVAIPDLMRCMIQIMKKDD